MIHLGDEGHRRDERVPQPAMAGQRGGEHSIDVTREPVHAARPARTIVFDDGDDLDIPEFLR